MKDFLFIHIPKNAGQSMQRVFAPHNKRCNLKQVCTISASMHLGRMSRTEFKSLFSFAFVRNPWDRQVSFYHFILNTPSHTLYELTYRLSFYEYVHQVLPYWPVVSETQKSYLFSKDNELLVNFVGRFESIEKDFRIVCDRIGLKVILPKINTTSHQPYREYYCEETRKIVADLFESDISTFSYCF